MRHVMIDIETLGTKPGTAPVLSIGAVSFDPYGESVEASGISSFYRELTLTGQLQPQGQCSVDPDTLAWWFRTNAEELGRLVRDGKEPLFSALSELYSFCKGWETINGYWSRGKFDLAILEERYNDIGMGVPWKYNQAREVRTLEATVRLVFTDNAPQPLHREQGGVHNALEDAIYQAQCVQYWLSHLCMNRDIVKEFTNE